MKKDIMPSIVKKLIYLFIIIVLLIFVLNLLVPNSHYFNKEVESMTFDIDGNYTLFSDKKDEDITLLAYTNKNYIPKGYMVLKGKYDHILMHEKGLILTKNNENYCFTSNEQSMLISDQCEEIELDQIYSTNLNSIPGQDYVLSKIFKEEYDPSKMPYTVKGVPKNGLLQNYPNLEKNATYNNIVFYPVDFDSYTLH